MRPCGSMSSPVGKATGEWGDADRLTLFLSQESGALAGWFGLPLAKELQRNPDRLRGLLDQDIAAIDELLSAQLDEILHHPRFQRLEGSWRGLAWMIDGFDPGARLKTKLLPASWQDLDRDFARSVERIRSVRFVSFDL